MDEFFNALTNKINKLSDWIKWINKLSSKAKTITFCFTLFICGGPCHLSCIKQCTGDLIFLSEQLVYSIMGKKMSLSLYYYLINIVNITILSLNDIEPLSSWLASIQTNKSHCCVLFRSCRASNLDNCHLTKSYNTKNWHKKHLKQPNVLWQM